MADIKYDTAAIPHSAVSYKRHRHIKVMVLGKGQTETPVVRCILVTEDSTFADIKKDLFDSGIAEATMLCSHYGLKPYWTEPNPNSKIGAICQTVYAVRAEGVPYILALVRHAYAHYPLVIFDFEQHPLEVAFPSTEATSDIKKEEVSITRYSDEKSGYKYESYESLKCQEPSTFPTCFIITVGQLPREFKDEMPPEAILPFLMIPYCYSTQLVRRAYDLTMFHHQTIHTTSALLHAIISLADLSNMSESRRNGSNGEFILTNEPLLADNLQNMIEVLEKILDTIETEQFDMSGNISKTLDDCYMELCGEYPGAVAIRNSYTQREKLKALDEKTMRTCRPRVANGGGGTQKYEKENIAPKLSRNLVRRQTGEQPQQNPAAPYKNAESDNHRIARGSGTIVKRLGLSVDAIDILRDISELGGHVSRDSVGPVLEKVAVLLDIITGMLEGEVAWKGLVDILYLHQQSLNQEPRRLNEAFTPDRRPDLLGPIKHYSKTMEEILASIVKESGLDNWSGYLGEKVKVFCSRFPHISSEPDQTQEWARQLSAAMAQFQPS